MTERYADAWPSCLATLETFANPKPGEPYPFSTVLYGQLLWVLAESISARSVLEIGVGPQAMSGLIFAHSMAERGGGQLVSVDVDPERPALGFRRMVEDLNVDWKVLHGDSLALVNDVAPLLDGPVDLLYIDGDHDYAHAYGDTVGYGRYLRPGGYLVIDDYPGSGEGVEPARAALEAIGCQFVHIAHEPPHGNGRLVMQKPR